jgi:(R,R)-butanediol dehydrogenase/meso-butanediol dehydrogenase/diacetyl reductase
MMGIFGEPSPKMHFADVVSGERTIVGSTAYYLEAPFVLDLLADGRIAPKRLITSIIPLEDTVESGFKELLTNKEAHLKILVESPHWE